MTLYTVKLIYEAGENASNRPTYPWQRSVVRIELAYIQADYGEICFLPKTASGPIHGRVRGHYLCNEVTTWLTENANGTRWECYSLLETRWITSINFVFEDINLATLFKLRWV